MERMKLQAEISTVDDRLVEATAMKKAVKLLHFGQSDEKLEAVMEMKRLAAGDPDRNRLLAGLGVMPILVSMLFELQDDSKHFLLLVDTLNELANATFKNKRLIVEAGLLDKMPQLMNTSDLFKNQQFALLLLFISSLSKTQFPVPPEPMLPLLVVTLNDRCITDETKLTCVESLYNLSIKLENTKAIVSSGAVHTLLKLSHNKMVSEGALATLSNLLLREAGKKAVEDDPLIPESLMEIMAWDDKPKTTELAAHILMVLAHKSKNIRQQMFKLGIIPLIVQVSLLGSPLAQKRVTKMLQLFKGEERSRGHSGPQTTEIPFTVPSSNAVDSREINECKGGVKSLARQSLDKNMEAIFARAHTSPEGFSSFKTLSATSSSKSLPFYKTM